MSAPIVAQIRALTLAAGMLACSGSAGAVDSVPADSKPFPIAIVETLNQLSGGPHAGFRANHAKGAIALGTFTPAPGAAGFSKAPHFAHRVTVLVRFSDTTGVPHIPDASPDASPHGMAIRFKLADGSSTDIVSISANGFPVATPEDFLALLRAVGHSGPGVAKPTPVEQFLGSHPAALKFVTAPRPAPQSFGTLAFYGVNAFKFTNAKGESHFARYQIIPVDGEHALSKDEASKATADYLFDELPQRLAKAAVRFRLFAQVAQGGDATNDATAVWPDDRQRVLLGTLTLTRMSANQANEQKAIMFNPLTLAAGIEPSNDPVLLARPGAYAVSYAQRAQ